MVEKSHTAGFWPSALDPLREAGQRVADWFAPRSEAAVEGEAYEIAIELPGVKAADIDVSAHDGALTVKGEKRFETTRTGRSYFFSEREYGAFQRTFRLPSDADESAIAADFADGVLTLRIPKTSPAPPEAKKIRINAR
jgi:HSP20 family protein